MRFVAPKSVYQKECLALHRIRQRLVMQRTAVVNPARGLLQEHRVVIANGIGCVRREWPGILEDASNELTPRMRAMVAVVNKNARVAWALLSHEQPYWRARVSNGVAV
jgi:transposase